MSSLVIQLAAGLESRGHVTLNIWNRADSVCSISTCKVWKRWLLAIWAIEFSDWLCISYMTILIGGVLANQCGVWEEQNTVCTLFFYALRSIISCFHVLENWHKTSTTRWLTASRTSAERTHYCGVGCKLKQCVQCIFFAKQVRREATEQSDKGSSPLVWVLVPTDIVLLFFFVKCAGAFYSRHHIVN